VIEAARSCLSGAASMSSLLTGQAFSSRSMRPRRSRKRPMQCAREALKPFSSALDDQYLGLLDDEVGLSISERRMDSSLLASEHKRGAIP